MRALWGEEKWAGQMLDFQLRLIFSIMKVQLEFSSTAVFLLCTRLQLGLIEFRLTVLRLCLCLLNLCIYN